LEDDGAGFIKKSIREVRLNPSILLRKVEQLIADIKDR